MNMATGNPFRNGQIPRAVTASLFLVVNLSACTSTPTPDQMSRTTLETAPADLQLLCASAAAKANNIDNGKVLPMNSRKLDAKTYQVELNVHGKTANCTINADGNVISIQPS